MLKIEHLSKAYGRLQAVSDLSFEAGRGEVFGLLGPNGAGKTTTIRVIIQMIPPDGGAITMDGRPLDAGYKDRIGYLPEERGLYRRSRVRDMLVYVARLKGLSKSKALVQMDAWSERLKMTDALHRRCEELSKGNQQKIQLMAALLHDPDLVILDEPFSGLDPLNQILFRDVIAELAARGKIVVLSAHQMDHVERMCRRICLMHQGRAVANTDIETLRRGFDSGRIRIQAAAPAIEKLMQAGVLTDMIRRGDRLEGRLSPGDTFAGLLQRVAATADVDAIEKIRPDLEDLFIRLVKP